MSFLRTTLAVMFPPISLLIDDNPAAALISMVMVATLIGWPFAAAWALRVMKENDLRQKAKAHQEAKGDDS